MPDGSEKTCVLCGESCVGQPRIKDARGRYYHKHCHEQALRRKQQREQEQQQATDAFVAAEPPPVSDGDDEVMSMLLDDADPAAPPVADSGSTCPSCGQGVAPGAVLCVNCGFNLQSGELVGDTTVNASEHHVQSGRFRFDALTWTMLSACMLFAILFGASFLEPPLVLAVFFCLVILTAVLWSLYFYIAAFREGFWCGVRVLFVPFYQWVFWFRCRDRILRYGLWVWVFGLALFVVTGAYHIYNEDSWNGNRERLLNPQPYTPRNKPRTEGYPRAPEVPTGSPDQSSWENN